MVSNLTIDGRWWIHGRTESPQFGTLKLVNGSKLTLVVKIPQDRTVREVMTEWLRSHSNRNERFPDVIVGRDASNKPVTLFGCHPRLASATGLTTYTVSAIAAVQGLELEAWSQECICAVAFDFLSLNNWLGGEIVEEVQVSGEAPSYRAAKGDDLLFDICNGVQMRIARFVGMSSSDEEYAFRPKPQVWLHFDSPKRVSDVVDWWTHRVITFFSLIIGDPITVDALNIYIQDPYTPGSGLPKEGKVIRRHPEEKESRTHTFEMLAAYPEVAAEFGAVVKNWFRAVSKLEPVVDLFSTVAFHSHLHTEAQFLFLVQSLEVYHARMFESTELPAEEHKKRVAAVVDLLPVELKDWVRSKLSANYKYLDQRLLDLFAANRTEAERLFRNVAELPERIRYTRNYLTHYNGDPASPKYLKDPEMIEVSWFLKIFVWICLLKEIGIGPNAIEKLIRRYANPTFVNL